jgi:DNA replication protein DnaC
MSSTLKATARSRAAAQTTALPDEMPHRFKTNLQSLRLPYMETHALSAAQEAARNGTGHFAFLEELVTGEAALHHDRCVTRRIAAARFPVIKTMAGWNWSAPDKINRMQIEGLLRLDFLSTQTNVILLGSAGLGKTHLASALGHAACLKRHSVLFSSTIDVVNRLSAAQASGQLARELKRYEAPELLILDELGYLPLDKRGAELLFQVISKRYELGSTIITTNIAFKEWPRIFAGDATMTSALLDRLLHHAETVVIEGHSFRSPRSQARPNPP